MSLICDRCSTKNSGKVRIISCGHSYCFECIKILYNSKSQNCLKGCKRKIIGKVDLLPFFQNDKTKENLLYDDQYDYSKRMENLTKILRYKNGRVSHILLKNNSSNEEKKLTTCTINEFLKMKKDRYLVYEIKEYSIVQFDICDSYDRIECFSPNKFLIYYIDSKICFIYERTFIGEYFRTEKYQLKDIFKNIEKETLDNLYLNVNHPFWQHKLFDKYNKWKSCILNPNGYVQFPQGFEKLYSSYINHTKDPYEAKYKKFYFENYRWIHFQDMVKLEEKYSKKIYFHLLMKKKILCTDIVNHILTFI